jgi:hypothetical protein
MLNLEHMMERYGIKLLVLYRRCHNGYNRDQNRIAIFEFSDWRDIERLIMCADYPFKRGGTILKRMIGDVDRVGLFHTSTIDYLYERSASVAPVEFTVSYTLVNRSYIAREYDNVMMLLEGASKGQQSGRLALITNKDMADELDWLGDWTIWISPSFTAVIKLWPYRRIDDHELTLFRLRWGHLLLAPMESSSYAAV